jgi:hypothetical protein
LKVILNDRNNIVNRQHDHDIIRRSFLDYTQLLIELIESIRMESNKLRQNLFMSIRSFVIDFNQLLPLIINRDTGKHVTVLSENIVTHVTIDLEYEIVVISFLLICFDLLRTQMGTELVQTILQSAFAAFNMFVEKLFNMFFNSHDALTFLVKMFVMYSAKANQKLIQLYHGEINERIIVLLYDGLVLQISRVSLIASQ